MEIFLVVILNAEPFENFRRHVCSRTTSHEIVNLFRKRGLIFQIKLTQNDPKRREVVILLLVQLSRGVKRSQGGLVILRFERGFADVILRLRGNRALGKFLQQLAKSVDHALGIFLLPQDESF